MKAPRESARLLGCEGRPSFLRVNLPVNERLVFLDTSPPDRQRFSQETSHFCLRR